MTLHAKIWWHNKTVRVRDMKVSSNTFLLKFCHFCQAMKHKLALTAKSTNITLCHMHACVHLRHMCVVNGLIYLNSAPLLFFDKFCHWVHVRWSKMDLILMFAQVNLVNLSGQWALFTKCLTMESIYLTIQDFDFLPAFVVGITLYLNVIQAPAKKEAATLKVWNKNKAFVAFRTAQHTRGTSSFASVSALLKQLRIIVRVHHVKREYR